MADHVVGIDDLDVVIDLDITGQNDAFAFLGKSQRGFVQVMHADRDILEVQQNFDDVFLQAFERRVFVQHAVDFDFNNRCARNRRQQNTTKCVAERQAETTLEWLSHEYALALAVTAAARGARVAGARASRRTLRILSRLLMQ